jgi:NADPH-dependent 2,4-dienoyl-CoA reductase/sulfur reductase-like enzyme
MAQHYLIVGTGAAGVAAAEAIRGQSSSAEIVLVGEDPHGYYSRPGLAYYLNGEVPERMLHPFSTGDFQRLALRLVQARITGLDPAAHRVELDTHDSLTYDKLLLATGSRASQPATPGHELEGVVKLDDMEDARRILKLSGSGRSAVVVGGGITALEVVEGLHARHVHTHYFLRKDRYWSNVLDEVESRLVEHRLQKDGIELHYNTDLAEIRGRRGHVTSVVTADEVEIPCGLVAIAVGVRPRLELATAAGLKAQRGIVVDEYLRTSVPDIWAAGDVAQAFDPAAGKAVMNTLWGVAVNQGRTAGLNMAGQVQPYRPGVPINVTRLARLTTTIIGTVGRGRDEDVAGLNRGDSEAWRQLAEATQGTGPVTLERQSPAGRLRVVMGDRTLLGAIVMGDQAISRPLHDLIGQQADITPIRDRLLDPAASLEDLLAAYWNQWRSGHAAQKP